MSPLGATFFLVALCSAQQQTLFRTEVNLINVSVLVRSSDGALITGLGKDDFEVREDGVPQRIQFFAREKEIPLSLGLVVDVSGSQDKFIKQHNKDRMKLWTVFKALPKETAIFRRVDPKSRGI
jgi:Ca-activated chloride channel family protein